MNYCTLFPEGWWAHCCQAHDLAYANQVGQSAADLELLQCVASSGSSPVLLGVSTVVAGVMWMGVRTFGKYFYKKAKP